VCLYHLWMIRYSVFSSKIHVEVADCMATAFADSMKLCGTKDPAAA
jgi:hypothetical protein